MSQRTIQRRRKRNRRTSYFILDILIFLLIVSATIILWISQKNTQQCSTEQMPQTVTQASRQAREELKKHPPQPQKAAAQTTQFPQSAPATTSIPPQQTPSATYQAQQKTDNQPWNLTLVNYNHPIPDNYQADLVELEDGEQIDKRIYDPLMNMLDDARQANLGKLPKVVSGYRTQEKQQSLYDEKIAKYKQQGYEDREAIKQAEQWVAVPGFSEHQLGFAVDINGAAYDVYLWLQQNSYKYGFIFRYPGNKTDITKVAEEVWHYRYVGVEAATEIFNQGLCLEEYLARQ